MAAEIDERTHLDRNEDKDRKREEEIKEELDCEFIRINSRKEHFNINAELGKIQNHNIESTKQLPEESTKKALIHELLNKLLRLEFKKDNSIKTKCFKYVVKKILPTL